ncbi:zinc-binding protein [Ectopseudomonas mendocina]|nr:zinc-binding protein [Pseudomonas mendocina]
MRHLLLALPFALLPLAAAQAHEHGHDHDHHHDSLGAHEHGVASLNVALDGNLLELQLDSPAMNLVGFEHAAKSDADKAKVAAAKRELEQPVSLFALSSGDCQATEVELQSPLFAGKAHDHKHDHHDHKHEGEHSDIHAHYRFECAKANELKQLDLAELFKRFPATEKIQVQLIGPNGQQGAELTAAQPRLSF